VRRLGAIELVATAQPVGEAESAAFWLAQVRERGLGWLQWSEGVDDWLGRVRWLRERSEAWPDLSEPALLARLEQWLLPWLAGVRRLDQLRALDFRSMLQGLLDYPLQQRLEREAPARLTLPSGCSHAIRYRPGQPPRLAARLQEFYGLDRHPLVGRGEPLLLELLSPAQRPLQLTRDLPGFWRSSYVEVKKEMRSRYPKHFWPDEPWLARATTRTKRGMGSPGPT
jgi:ATP-dependent helicase HrpB